MAIEGMNNFCNQKKSLFSCITLAPKLTGVCSDRNLQGNKETSMGPEKLNTFWVKKSYLNSTSQATCDKGPALNKLLSFRIHREPILL